MRVSGEPGGQVREETQQVLGTIAESRTAGDTGLERRHRAAHVERDHALVRVPDVDHAVRVGVRRADPQYTGRTEAQGRSGAAGTRPATVAGRSQRSITGRTRALFDDPGTGRVELLGPPGSPSSRAGRSPRGPRRGRALIRTWWLPMRRRAMRDRLRQLRRARPLAAGPSRDKARGTPPAGCRIQRAGLERAKSRRSDYGAPGTRSCGRSHRRRPPLRRSRSLRWKLVASSCASQRQNSAEENTDRSGGKAGSLRDADRPRLRVFRRAARSKASRHVSRAARTRSWCRTDHADIGRSQGRITWGCHDGDQ